MQFNSDGTRDLSFGVGGEAVAPTLYDHNEAWSIAVQPDGAIIVGGFTKSSSFLGPIVGQYVMARFAAAECNRIRPLGKAASLSGTVANTWTPPIAAVLLQSDGKIVAVIWGDVLRFLPNGTLDPGFGVMAVRGRHLGIRRRAAVEWQNRHRR